MRKNPGSEPLNVTRRRTDSIHRKPPEFTKRPTQLKQHSPRRPTSRKIRRVFFFAVLIAIVVSLGFVQQVFFAKETVEPLKNLIHLPVIRDIRNFVGANDGKLKGVARDRVNVLILGQGGAGHDGPYLTDTIILASFKPTTGQIALLSIPRDMVVNIPGVGYERVNAANAYSETSEYPGGGAAFAARVIEDTLNQQINYYIRIDFAGFVEVVDELGGIEVDIERAFTDNEYPDGNLGFKTVHFDAGKQTLSGEQALEYVRSRHSEVEAGDFSRARRQHKVMIALKEKILSPLNILNPARLIKLYSKFDDHVATNIQTWEISEFIKIGKDADFNTVSFKILDDSPAGPLYSTTLANGAYVLAPKITDYSEIQFIANNLFTINSIQKESATLTIQNGTTEEGLAQSTAEILRAFEFSVVSVENAPSQNYQKTVLYDLTAGGKTESLKFLESTLQTKAQQTLPLDELGQKADFLIILGDDQLPNATASDRESSLNVL